MAGGYQEPQTEYTGIETFYPYMDNCNYQTTKGVHFRSIQRHVVAIFGSLESEYAGTSISDALPYHFGYDRDIDSISELYKESPYVIMNKEDEVYYDHYHSQMQSIRWTDEDYVHFEFDDGVNRVYSNDGLRIYVVL